MDRGKKETYTSDIEGYEGIIPVWFIISIIILLAWGAYYLIQFWGGFGPGY
jgi:hypothetical protein